MTVALVGVVSSAVTQPEICVMQLDRKLNRVVQVEEVGLECENIVLLFNHDSFVDHSACELVVIGGGGNCFSFGMNVNQIQLRIPINQLTGLFS